MTGAVTSLRLDGLYTKSAKGRDVLAQQGSALPRQLRAVLILIDGKVSLKALLERYSSIPAFRDSIECLFELGLIDEVRRDESVAAPQGSPVVGPTAGVSAKARLIELAGRLLGANAGRVVARLDKSDDSPHGLASAVENCHKLIRLTIDEKLAEQFRAAAQRIVAAQA